MSSFGYYKKCATRNEKIRTSNTKMNIGFILKWIHTCVHYTYVNTSNFNLIHIP